jgi:hypothetical protein
MKTTTVYLDPNHNIVAADDATFAVTTEVDDEGVVVAERWDRLKALPPPPAVLRQRAIRRALPLATGAGLLLSAWASAVAGAPTPVSTLIAVIGVGLVAWGWKRTVG